MLPFETKVKIATTPTAKMTQEIEFDDVALHSDSMSSDGSYDFADDANIGGKVMPEVVLPSYRERSTTVADSSSNISKRHDPKDSGKSWLGMLQQAEDVVTNTSTSPSSKEERGKEKQNDKWLQELQMTTGDTDVESIASDDSNLILDVEASYQKTAFRKKDGKAQQKLAELNVAIEIKNKIIQKLLEDDAKYLTLLEKTHEEEVAQLKQKHQEDNNAKLEDTVQTFKLNEDDWMKCVKKEQEEKIQSNTVQYEAIIAEKDEERTSYKAAISELQQTYHEYVAALKRQHENEMNKTTDEFQSILADNMQKQDVRAENGLQERYDTLVAQKDAEINRLKSMEKRYKKEIQEQYQIRVERQLRETNYESLLDDLFTENKKLKQAADLAQTQFADQQAASMLAAHPTTSRAKDEKVNPEGEQELLAFSTLNCKRSYEQDLQEADRIIEQIKNLKQQLNDSEAKVKHLEGILGKAQNKIVAKHAKLEQELEQRDAKEAALEKEEARAMKLERALIQAENENFDLHFKVLEMEEKEKLGVKVQDTIYEFTDRLDDLKKELAIVTETTDEYANNIDFGCPDLQEEWNNLLNEMDRILHEPYHLLNSVCEKLIELNEPNEVEVDEHGEIIGNAGANADESVTKEQDQTAEVKELRNSLESALEDNKKLSVALAKAIEERNTAEGEVQDMSNHLDDLEFLLEDEQREMFIKLYEKLKKSKFELKQLTGVVELLTKTAVPFISDKQCEYASQMATTSDVSILKEALDEVKLVEINALREKAEMEAKIVYLEQGKTKYKKQALSFEAKYEEYIAKQTERETKLLVKAYKDWSKDCGAQSALAEELRDELEIVENDIKELQMVIHRAEQRASSAEAELRGIGQDIEEYVKQHKARDMNIMIDRVTGCGARNALDSVFWLLGTERQRLSLEIARRQEAEKKLREIEDDVEDILFCNGYYGKLHGEGELKGDIWRG
jgi:uncharacterized protein YuzE